MAQTKKRADLFLPPEEDPREGGPTLGDERATLVEYLRYQRLTLELKCADLGPEQLARRSVPPSTMSLLGLVRHLAEVERRWFRVRMSGLPDVAYYISTAEPDADWDGAAPDQALVDEAWRNWRTECAFADRFVAEAPTLDVTGRTAQGPVSLREVLVHMIEEYARHNGHADLLRELIDGRVGQ
ncbi:DinB family protein [Streptomyces sp. 8K308]|uniref:DinB family protein n=1 Tax=Streptomyces sp. 8K308 TaxID=2530388 RepID=UPI00104D4B69|nr:DinB family protein [Streptomyces sp. 8K308]TDC24794.1 DinB family protein [Streptomyces sp. 8K308]